ncbi:hypothetical protein AB833_20665 [Chromatiales bacterium (ex Bugula neritina AB1)]|nr:hypothetical protein AB833_20665 [Chromatiales bacterium (ex Bugula neritina AB1)]
MQFHLNGFNAGDPSVEHPGAPISVTELDWQLPAEVDNLIVGCGPAGLTLAARMAVYPSINTCIVDSKFDTWRIAQADGIACRTVDIFEALGFSERVLKEAY